MQTYKSHRNRYSLSHLSSETTATLPEYAAAFTAGWPHPSPARGVQQPRAGKAFTEPEGWPSDRPPDYPDSADEADEETDSVAGDGVLYGGSTISLPPLLVSASHAPRCHVKRYSSSISPPGQRPNNDHQHYTPLHSHRNSRYRSPYLHFQRLKPSAALPLPSPTDDPYLDSLLERSVHALEMSNTLLQSSISTQTSLSKLLKAPMVETSTSRHVDEERKGDALERVRNVVDSLLGEAEASRAQEAEESDWEPTGRRARKAACQQSTVSSSLPILSSMPGRRACKRRPSQLELQNSSKTCVPRLTYIPQNRSRLVAPAPRAMTQYVVASSAEAESITLPSTLGMQTQTVVKLPEPPTPAYNMLTSFVRPAPSSMPSSVSSPSVLTSLMMRRRSNSVTSILGSGALARITRRGSSIDDSCLLPPPSPEPFRSRTPRPAASPAPHRPMTPPTEESTSSSSSSESLIAKQTVMSLRKILDDQAAKSDSTLDASSRRYPSRRAPAFLPVTPVPAPQVGTSNATASISRLFTKAIHTSSTRPPSPPRHSALKNGNGSRSSISAMQQADASASTSAAAAREQPSNGGASAGQIYANGRTNPLLRINVAKAQLGMLPELVSAGVARAFGSVRANGASTPSSGQSTPKRISFAELPEGSRPEGQSSRFRNRRRRRRRLLNGQGGTVFSAEGENEGSEGRGMGTLGEAWEVGSPPIGGWWPGWLSGGSGGVGSALAGMGGSSGGMYVSRYEERMGDRLNRPWSGLGRLDAAPGYGGLDDWAV